jgi:hypothetical protein
MSKTFNQLFRNSLIWIVIVGAAVVIAVLSFLSTYDSRIPANAGFPDNSVDPVFKEPERPSTAYCPRSDYILKWIVWGGEFVPRCVRKGTD